MYSILEPSQVLPARSSYAITPRIFHLPMPHKPSNLGSYSSLTLPVDKSFPLVVSNSQKPLVQGDDTFRLRRSGRYGIRRREALQFRDPRDCSSLLIPVSRKSVQNWRSYGQIPSGRHFKRTTFFDNVIPAIIPIDSAMLCDFKYSFVFAMFRRLVRANPFRIGKVMAALCRVLREYFLCGSFFRVSLNLCSCVVWYCLWNELLLPCS